MTCTEEESADSALTAALEPSTTAVPVETACARQQGGGAQDERTRTHTHMRGRELGALRGSKHTGYTSTRARRQLTDRSMANTAA